MSRIKIESLTPEQEAKIPEFLEKWVGVCSKPLNREKATEAINALYKRMGQDEPKIVFVQSPRQAALLIALFSNQLWDQLGGQLRDQIYNRQEPEWFIPWAAWLEFASLIGVQFDAEKYDLFLRFCRECGWVFPFKRLVLVSERPVAVHWDSDRRLHAEGKLAVEFADGWGIFAHHGVRLPEKYGKSVPSLWRPQWLLEEDNAELRRVLIEGIGYERICSELDAKSLDTWREYELLRIESVDVEPIVLVKMTCPSTGFVHVHRVPPESRTAREAIAWVNHGVDPESFLIER